MPSTWPRASSKSASPGEILASERTAGAAEMTFLFGEGRSITAKGKSQPLRVFPLASQRPERKRTVSPLVGRKPDLALSRYCATGPYQSAGRSSSLW